MHLFEAISVQNADSLFLVLEYLPGGVLMNVKLGQDDKDAKPPFSQECTREYFRQICLGLEYLHANGVAHRDVSPLLLQSLTAKLNFRSSPTTSCSTRTGPWSS